MRKIFVRALLLSLSITFTSQFLVSAQVIGDVAPDQSSEGCTDLSYNLTYKKSKDANTDGQVSDLQYFLQDQGLLKVDPNGIFGPSTLRAVQSFQKKSGLLSSGYVGSITRAKIKEISCAGTGSVISTSSTSTQPTEISNKPTEISSTNKQCRYPGTKSEGWYDAPTGKLIRYENCEQTTIPPTSKLGIYKGYMNSRQFISTEAISKDEAYSNCKTNSMLNPKSDVRCTWNGEEIYSIKALIESSMVKLAAVKTSVDYGMQSALTWTSTNVSSCKFTEGDTQFKNYENTTSGTNRYTQSLYVTQRYTIECLGNDGTTVRSSLDISVSPKVSIPTPVVSATELHVVGVYESSSNHSFCYSSPGNINVRVRNTGKPIILALSSYEPEKWNVILDAGADVKQVIVGGYDTQTVTGLPSTIPVSTFTYYSMDNVTQGDGSVFYDSLNPDGKHYHWASQSSTCPESAGVPVDRRVSFNGGREYYLAYQKGDADYNKWANKLKSITGLEVTSFQGAYSATSFTVPSVVAMEDANSLTRNIATTFTESQVLGASVACVQIPYNMHRGNETAQVKVLQKLLQQKGILDSDPTGFYGDKTVEAVKMYQSIHGIKVTGMVYEATRQAIKAETCLR